MYSANPWIESFAHTVPRCNIITKVKLLHEWSNKTKYFYYNLHSSRLAQSLAAENKQGSESSSSLCSHRRCMSVVNSKPRRKHLKHHRKSNLQQSILLQRVGQNPLILASDFWWTHMGKTLSCMLNLAGGAFRLSLHKARFVLSLLNKTSFS